MDGHSVNHPWKSLIVVKILTNSWAFGSNTHSHLDDSHHLFTLSPALLLNSVDAYFMVTMAFYSFSHHLPKSLWGLLSLLLTLSIFQNINKLIFLKVYFAYPTPLFFQNHPPFCLHLHCWHPVQTSRTSPNGSKENSNLALVWSLTPWAALELSNNTKTHSWCSFWTQSSPKLMEKFLIFRFIYSFVSYLFMCLTFIEPIIWAGSILTLEIQYWVSLLLLCLRTSWERWTEINSPPWIQKIMKAHRKKPLHPLKESENAAFVDCLLCVRHSSKWLTFIHFIPRTTLFSRYYYCTIL